MKNSRRKEIVDLAKVLFSKSYYCNDDDLTTKNKALYALYAAKTFYEMADKKTKKQSLFQKLFG